MVPGRTAGLALAGRARCGGGAVAGSVRGSGGHAGCTTDIGRAIDVDAASCAPTAAGVVTGAVATVGTAFVAVAILGATDEGSSSTAVLRVWGIAGCMEAKWEIPRSGGGAVCGACGGAWCGTCTCGDVRGAASGGDVASYIAAVDAALASVRYGWKLGVVGKFFSDSPATRQPAAAAAANAVAAFCFASLVAAMVGSIG